MQGAQAQGPGRAPLITAVGILIVVVVAFGFSYLQSSSTISSLNSQVAVMQGQLGTAESNTALLARNITSLESQLATAEAENATDAAQIGSYRSQLAAIQAQLAGENSTIGSLRAQVASSDSQVTSLQTSVSGYQNQVASLQSEMAGLQNQVTNLQNLLSLSSSTVEVSGFNVTEPAGTLKQVAQFTASYAGYALVTGKASSENGYIGIDIVYPTLVHSLSGQSLNFAFGSGGTYVALIPIVPGSIILYYGNYDTSGKDNATLTVTYFY